MDKTQVMIVEDNAVVAEDCHDSLMDLGYCVSSIVASGEEAVEKAEKEQPEIVLMDIHLRDKMDGIEAAKQMYKHFGIPVVFLSAYSDKDLLKRAGHIGAFGYLIKPFSENELNSTIEIALYKAKMEKKQAQDRIRIQNLLLEKEVILKEVHHRIKNNMHTIKSLLSIQSDLIKIPEVVVVFQDAIGRIESMGVLYDKLYKSENYHDVSIKTYFTELIDEIIGIFPQHKNIKIEKNIEDFIIHSKILFPLGIILNELLTNTMKYAFPNNGSGIVQVSIRKKGTHVTLVVKDNGVGFPIKLENQIQDGFGVNLIRMLTEQIDGSFRIENSDGTRAIIGFDL